jgi:hypothetical protein
MDEQRKLERDFYDVNFQIQAIQRLLAELEARRQIIYDAIQAEIGREKPATEAAQPRGGGRA